MASCVLLDGRFAIVVEMRIFRLEVILAGVFATAAIGTSTGCKAGETPHTSNEREHQASITPTGQLTMPSPPVEPSAEAAEDTRPMVVCFGDSLTAGYGADDGQAYPDYLQRDLDRAGVAAHVINEGISGNTTKDGVDRLGTVTALKPAVVVLEFGGNDGLRGLKVATTRANLATMIEALKAAGAKVVIAGITLPPDYGNDYVSHFTSSYQALGAQYRLPVLPFLLKDVYGVKGLMQADNIHATASGNAVVARNVLPYVERALRGR